MVYLGVCHALILFKHKNSLQAMESNGIFQPHLQQKGLVREYNSCGLEYFLGPYKWAIPREAK